MFFCLFKAWGNNYKELLLKIDSFLYIYCFQSFLKGFSERYREKHVISKPGNKWEKYIMNYCNYFRIHSKL